MNIKKLIAALCQIALLTALFVGASLAADAPEATQTIAKEDITLNIKSALASYKDLVITENNGNVTISGTVATQHEKDAIAEVVLKQNGVKSVKNELEVKGDAGGVGEYIDDAAITAVIKGKLLGQSGLDSLDISVDTNQGVVTLSGEVPSDFHMSLAERLAKETDGVKLVVNRLAAKK